MMRIEDDDDEDLVKLARSIALNHPGDCRPDRLKARQALLPDMGQPRSIPGQPQLGPLMSAFSVVMSTQVFIQLIGVNEVVFLAGLWISPTHGCSMLRQRWKPDIHPLRPGDAMCQYWWLATADF